MNSIQNTLVFIFNLAAIGGFLYFAVRLLLHFPIIVQSEREDIETPLDQLPIFQRQFLNYMLILWGGLWGASLIVVWCSHLATDAQHFRDSVTLYRYLSIFLSLSLPLAVLSFAGEYGKKGEWYYGLILIILSIWLAMFLNVAVQSLLDFFSIDLFVDIKSNNLVFFSAVALSAFLIYGALRTWLSMILRIPFMIFYRLCIFLYYKFMTEKISSFNEKSSIFKESALMMIVTLLCLFGALAITK